MTMIRKLIGAQIRSLGADEVEVIMSTSALARDGHVLLPGGCNLTNYRLNPIVLWGHDPDHPVGNAENIAIGTAALTARVRFAPEGVSRKADEVRGLTKAGVIRAVSVGFDPLDMEPLDPQRPRGGQRITRWELLELSFVSVPADPGAMVTARATREGKTLSSANAAILQQAHDDAERCRTALAGMLTGTADSSARDADFRRRQADALALRYPPLSADHDWRLRQADALVLSQGVIESGECDLARRRRDAQALARAAR